MQGTILGASNPLLPAGYLDPLLGQTTAMELDIDQQEITTDSIRVTINVNTTDNNTLPQQLLLAALVTEDTVFYNAPNGEGLHHDVFRQALTQVTGDLFSKPGNGNGATISFTYKIKPGWVKERIRIIGFIQRSDTKEIINAGTSNALLAGVINGIDDMSGSDFTIYPNPVADVLNISSSEGLGVIEIYNAVGQMVLTENVGQQTQTVLSVSTLPHGVYLLKTGNGKITKLIKQ